MEANITVIGKMMKNQVMALLLLESGACFQVMFLKDHFKVVLEWVKAQCIMKMVIKKVVIIKMMKKMDCISILASKKFPTKYMKMES